MSMNSCFSSAWRHAHVIGLVPSPSHTRTGPTDSNIDSNDRTRGYLTHHHSELGSERLHFLRRESARVTVRGGPWVREQLALRPETALTFECAVSRRHQCMASLARELKLRSTVQCHCHACSDADVLLIKVVENFHHQQLVAAQRHTTTTTVSVCSCAIDAPTCL